MLTKVFNQLDINKDGFLTQKELIDGWNVAFHTHITDEEIQSIFANIDTNQNEKIDYSEFIMACIDRNRMLSDKRLE